MADAQAWAEGWQHGTDASNARRDRKNQLSDEQRQLKENELATMAQNGQIGMPDYAKGIDTLYQHEPTESRMGRIGRGLERMVGMKGRADKQKAEADAKLAAQPSPKAEFSGIVAGAKTPKAPDPANPYKDLETQLRSVGVSEEDIQKAVRHKAGLDAKGAEPAGPKPISEYQKAQIDFRNKQLALQKAKFDAAQNPNNPATKAALLRAQGEAQRSQAYMIRAKASATGTDLNGNPLPGANVDAAGNPIGAMFSGNVKPTGAEIGRADLAASALDQITDMKRILESHSDMFGPGEGRLTNMQVWIGSQDPDAQRMTAAAVTAADHLMGVFGGRSSATGKRIESLMDNFATNPEATLAALEQYAKAAKLIQQKGTRHTVGGNPQNPEPAPKKAQGGGKTKGKVSLKKAMSMPENKGRNEAAVRSEIQAQGFEVAP